MRTEWFFILSNLNPLHQRCTVAGLVEIGPVVLDKKIVKFCYLLLHFYLPLKNDRALY